MNRHEYRSVRLPADRSDVDISALTSLDAEGWDVLGIVPAAFYGDTYAEIDGAHVLLRRTIAGTS